MRIELDADWTGTDIGGDDWRIVNSWPGTYDVWRNGRSLWVDETSDAGIIAGAVEHSAGSFHGALEIVYAVAQAFPPYDSEGRA